LGIERGRREGERERKGTSFRNGGGIKIQYSIAPVLISADLIIFTSITTMAAASLPGTQLLTSGGREGSTLGHCSLSASIGKYTWQETQPSPS